MWRRARFPHDRARLTEAISLVHSDPVVASAYLSGVIDGFCKNDPPFIGFSRNQPRCHGLNDGGKLARGELTLAEIPSYREVLAYLDHERAPGVREEPACSI